MLISIKKKRENLFPHLPPQVSRSYLLNSQLPSVIQKGNDCSSTGNYQKLQRGNKTLTSIWWKQIRFLWSSKGIEQNTNKRNACIAIYSCFHSSIEYFNCSKCQGWQHNKRYMTGCNAFTNQGTIFWVGYQESEEYAWAIVKPREVWLVTTLLAHRNLVTQSFPFSGALWPQPPQPPSPFSRLNRPLWWVVPTQTCPHWLHSHPMRLGLCSQNPLCCISSVLPQVF